MKRLGLFAFAAVCVAFVAPAQAAPTASEIVKHYQDMALAMYGEALAKAEALDKSIKPLSVEKI